MICCNFDTVRLTPRAGLALARVGARVPARLELETAQEPRQIDLLLIRLHLCEISVVSEIGSQVLGRAYFTSILAAPDRGFGRATEAV